jgi:phosphohistidine phosphatase
MKTLFLMRHATAEAHDGPDRDRPLAPEGLFEAQRIARHLAAREPSPDPILCSDARRALETAAALSQAFGTGSARAHPDLYLASPGEILSLVQDLPDTAEAALVVAHNPGIGVLARSLPRSATAQNGSRLSRFPPAALAEVAFPDGTWADVAPGRGLLAQVVLPSDLV